MFQIRRSAERLWGLRLAVFDGLLFLLLALEQSDYRWISSRYEDSEPSVAAPCQAG